MYFRFSMLIAVLTLGAIQAAECCTIPVFRYALDRWEADAFRLKLPTSARDDAALNDLLRPLRANGRANVEIRTAQTPTQSQAELWPAQAAESPVWSGKLDETTLAALLDSPVRQEILRRLLEGESVIWVIAGDGTPAATAEAARIEKRLRFLEQVAALPIQDPNDPDSQLGPGPPLRLAFTTLKLRVDDPAEQVLLRMLAGPDAGKDMPAFAAAVFGRGRVLGAWPLTVLDDATLEEACMFLVGRCSCRVKNENPGWDILMNVDWEKALLQSVTTPAPLAKAEIATSTVPETVRIESKQAMAKLTRADPESAGAAVIPLWLVGLGSGLLSFAGLWLFFRKGG